MDISRHIESFVKKSHRYKPYSKICRKMLIGGMPYSLNSQEGYGESEYLPFHIQSCVQAYASTKDTAIELFKDLVLYLEAEGVSVPPVHFPPVPVSNTFERLMFIAKYLQNKENRISELTDILWVNPRTIEDDLSRLYGCTGRGFKGQGFDDLKGLIETLQIFTKVDCAGFIIRYPELCTEFTRLYREARAPEKAVPGRKREQYPGPGSGSGRLGRLHGPDGHGNPAEGIERSDLQGRSEPETGDNHKYRPEKSTVTEF